MKDDFKVQKIPSKETYEWLLKKHYARRVPSISFAFGLFENNKLKGVCTFGRTAFMEASLLCGEGNKDKVYELNRLCVESEEKNIISFFISRCFKLLPTPLVLISYSDEGQGHHGYIYQATNWLYTGYGQGAVNYITSIGKLSRSGMRNRETRGQSIPEIYNIERGTKKHRYVYFLGNKKEKTNLLRNLKYESLPYPKGLNKRYDASYKPISQGLLF